MNELIERLEKATGPDRALDLAIGEAVGAANHSGPASHRPFRDWAKHYTASIDAAMTLVPEACAWQCGCEIDFTPTARVWGHDTHVDEFGATPVLALCIAALKARSRT